jgi:hypothetical protein
LTSGRSRPAPDRAAGRDGGAEREITKRDASPFPSTLRVRFDRRSHNPILREAALDRDCPPIPWLSGYRVEFDYR